MISARVAAWVAILMILVSARVRAAETAEADGTAGGWGPKIMHLPVQERREEQGILQPIPMSVELPGDLAWTVARVLVSYRLWGEPDWSTIQLRPVGPRYEGAVPCLEVSTVTGDFRYYIRVYDTKGHLIAQGGSRASPYIVTIKHDAMLSPAQRARAKCPDPSSCPRGLPGCPSEAAEVMCESDRDCDEGTECNRKGVCAKAPKKNRFTLSVSQDFGVMATSGACAVASQESEGTTCYRADGARYAGSPVLTNEPLRAARSEMRIVAGYDRLVSDNTTLGVRVGWALPHDGPADSSGASFVPLSVSARATHWFGDDPFAARWLRPYAFVTGGYAMLDIKAQSHVREDPTATSPQAGNDLDQTVTVWKRAGDGLIGAGAGLSFVFAPRRESFMEGLFVEIAVSQSFPYAATVVTPSAGIHLLP